MLSSVLFESLTNQYENSPVPFAIADHQLQVIWYNQSAQIKCPSLVTGKGLASIKLTTDISSLKDTLCSGQIFYTPCLQEALFRYAVTIVPVMDGTQLSGALITASEAVNSNRNIGAEHISAVFSQQIREPLYSIFASLQHLHSSAEQNKLKSNKVQHSLQQINQQCYHLLRFTMNFTEILRLENGVNVQNQQRVELCSMLERLCSALYLTALDKGITFSFQLPQKPLYLLCDTDRLTYAILLLMANAFQFAPKGNISMTVTAESTGIHVVISDDGCGISAEHLPHIYDLCYSYNPDIGCPAGPGLGLTLLQQIIHASGGTLIVTSEGSGKGTTAAFDFPYENDSAIPLVHMDPIKGHFNDRFSLFQILMSGVTEAPEL